MFHEESTPNRGKHEQDDPVANGSQQRVKMQRS